MTATRPVFFVSDGTGITAETIGHSLLTQFTGTPFATDRIPFVDTADKARGAADEIRRAGVDHGIRPIVVNSCVDPELNALLAESGALMLDVFAPFIEPLERELGTQRQNRVGQAHGIVDFESYHRRINAMNYALTHDDGVSMDLGDADLVLIGVSRAGKTPTCVYLALHHGVRAANYPLTEEDLVSDRLPMKLRPHRAKLFGLTIDPMRLQQIRQERPAVVAEGDLLLEAGLLDGRVADHAGTLPAADQPGQGGELAGEVGVEGELHQRGVLTRR